MGSTALRGDQRFRSSAQRSTFEYDIYAGEMFERSASAQVAFLERVLKVSAPTS